MKSNNQTDLRPGKAGRSQLGVRFLAVGLLLYILSWGTKAPVKDWVLGIGTLALIAGLVVTLSETVAARKKLESQRKNETR